jgi:hypothetical protein
MLDGGLVRADQITEITLHQTPEIAGKPPHWLLDVTTAVSVGSGDRVGWYVGPLHHTLAQVHTPPRDAPATLARLLTQLDAEGVPGILRADTARSRTAPHAVRFTFTPFAGAESGEPVEGADHPDPGADAAPSEGPTGSPDRRGTA